MDSALEDYVNHIRQKSRLILAISIIKSKPHDLNVENYINILRSKIVDEMSLSSVCSDDFLFDDDLTQVDNQTFMINPVDNCDNNKETNNVEHDNNNENASDNIHANNTNKLNNTNKCLDNENKKITDNFNPALFKDVQDANNNDMLTSNDTLKLNNHTSRKSESKDGLHAESFKKQTNNHKKENDSNKNANNCNNEMTDNYGQCYDINDNGVINDNTMIVDTQETGDDIDLLQYFASYGMWNDNKNDLENVFDALREADEKVTQTQATDNTDKTFYDSQLNVDVNKPNFKTTDDPTIDSQQTEIYTVHGFTQNQYSISQSQTQVDIPQKYLYNKRDKNIKDGKKIETPDLIGQSHCNQYKNNKTISREDFTDVNIISSSKNANTVKSNSKGSTQLYIKDIPANNVIQQEFKNDKDVTYQSNKADESRKCSLHSQDNVKSKSPTTLHAKENASNNNTEKILENIYQNEFTETNLINTNVNKNNDNYNNTLDINDINRINKQNISHNKFINKFIDSDVFNISNNKLKEKDTSNYSCITYLNTQEESNIGSEKMHATQKDDNNKIISNIILNNNHDETKRNEDMKAQTDSKYNDEIQNTAYHNDDTQCMNLDSDNMKIDANMINIMEKIDVDEVDSIENMEVDVEEVIPFKIVEELNKVKYFMNKNERKISKDGYLTDSGYRTSDTKYNKSLSQPCVNQSGHTLYNFLSTCPLSAQTKEISTEISTVLGNLLDQFHETENYPPFLEELLDCVKLLLKNLHQEESAEDSLLRKEELCQRILLINKSRHIQKFTIEQISNILEEIHEQFTKKDTKHDIENINSIENLCYVFSVLKLILIKYVKYKDRLSQTENISQEGSLKKSSITDIWKRKWDSNFKIQNVEHSVEKQNVLERLSGILNKLIVECMDGYSLVAYSALICFNILQS